MNPSSLEAESILLKMMLCCPGLELDIYLLCTYLWSLFPLDCKPQEEWFQVCFAYLGSCSANPWWLSSAFWTLGALIPPDSSVTIPSHLGSAGDSTGSWEVLVLTPSWKRPQCNVTKRHTGSLLPQKPALTTWVGWRVLGAGRTAARDHSCGSSF